MPNLLPSLIAFASFSLTLSDPFAAAETVAKSYSLELVRREPVFPVKTQHGPITGKAAEAKALERYAGLFAVEFAIYPAEFVKKSKLKRVVFCAELAFAGQRRTAIPDFEHDTLYLDVARSSDKKYYLHKVLHHEFFHIIDYRDDGKLYQDERWASLNPASFKYGNGGKNAQNNSDTSMLTDKYPGFLNHYSTTGVEEDKAELFANMIVEAEYVAKRVETDAVLKSKVERMKELTAKFCPEMTEEFLKRAGRVKRTE